MTFAAPAWTRRSACAALALAAGVAAADPIDRILVDRSLRARQVTIAAISSTAVELLHDDGTTEPVPLAEIAAILPNTPDAVDPNAWFTDGVRTGIPVIVNLVDGQRVLGHLPGAGVDRLAPESAMDAAIVEIPGSGPIGVPLDRLSDLVLVPDAGDAPAKTADDVALLRNGDRATGYVLSVQPRLEIETDAGVVTLALTDVARVSLANPVEQPHTTHVALDHGAVFGVSDISTALNQTVRLTLSLSATDAPSDSEASTSVAVVETTLESIVSLTPTAAGARPLASLGFPAYQPTGDRRWSPPPATIAHASHAFSSIAFPGPLRATWALPEGTSRFAARATLGLVPGMFADCEVVISVETPDGPVELQRSRIRASDPHADVLVPIPADAGTITLAVLPGENGPVHDRVTFERPMILVE
ncbi:MAG: hypothetical protein RIB60_02025 [Phycisphaerales bacterium]